MSKNFFTSLNKEKISYINEFPYKDNIQIRKLNENYNNYSLQKIYFENPQYLSISYSFELEKKEKILKFQKYTKNFINYIISFNCWFIIIFSE